MRMTSLALLSAASILSAQTYRVPLEVREGPVQFGFMTYPLVSDDATHLHVAIPGGTTLSIERLPAPLSGIQVTIPDGDPHVITLLPDQSSRIDLKRKVGDQDTVPYVISYGRSEKNGKLNENIAWIPSYRAEGQLNIGDCKVNLAVLDFNGDGKFDEHDSLQATTLQMDINGDGRFWGHGESSFMKAVVHLCGMELQVAALDPDGKFITFQPAVRPMPQIGKTLPKFSVPLTTGGQLTSANLLGKVTVLDFWASWCAICVAKMGDVESLANESTPAAHFYGINVDEPFALTKAKRILTEKKLSYPQVMQGLGAQDPLWRQFGSMNENDLSTPLYVVIDDKGVIRYAAGGGEDLGALKTALHSTIIESSR